MASFEAFVKSISRESYLRLTSSVPKAIFMTSFIVSKYPVPDTLIRSNVNKFVNKVFPPFLLSTISISGLKPEVEKLL